MKPLTPKMLAVLRQLAEPKAVAHYMPYMGRFRPHPYWFISGRAGEPCTAQVDALVRRGLVHEHTDQFDRTTATITPAGRKALKEQP